VPFVHKRSKCLAFAIGKTHPERFSGVEARESEEELTQGAIARHRITGVARHPKHHRAPMGVVLERLGAVRFPDNVEPGDSPDEASGQHGHRERYGAT
jgi:hypothetical protein